MDLLEEIKRCNIITCDACMCTSNCGIQCDICFESKLPEEGKLKNTRTLLKCKWLTIGSKEYCEKTGVYEFCRIAIAKNGNPASTSPLQAM